MLVKQQDGFLIKILSILFLLAFTAGVALLQATKLDVLKDSAQSSQRLQRQTEATSYGLTLAQRLPFFGFNNLLSDWFFLQFLQYFGDEEARTKTGYGLSPEFFEVIIPRDPYFRLNYLFLSNSVSQAAALPEQSVDLMAQGLQKMTPTTPPDSFYVWRYRGVDELLYLGDAAAARNSFEMAANWANQSDHPDSALMAELSQTTANFLAQNPDSKWAQISAWGSVLVNAYDEATRSRAIQAIENLGGRVEILPDGRPVIQYSEED